MAKKQIEEVVVEEVVATVEEVVNEAPVEKQSPGHNTRAFRQ
jgi:hypothetical protein